MQVIINTKRHSLVVCSSISQPVFQENKIYNFKIHLFSFLNTNQTKDGIFSNLNTNQTNDGIFSNKTGENFSLAKTFWNVRVRL